MPLLVYLKREHRHAADKFYEPQIWHHDRPAEEQQRVVARYRLTDAQAGRPMREITGNFPPPAPPPEAMQC